jgi:hypothetical protein
MLLPSPFPAHQSRSQQIKNMMKNNCADLLEQCSRTTKDGNEIIGPLLHSDELTRLSPVLQSAEYDADVSGTTSLEPYSSPLGELPYIPRKDRLRFEHVFALEFGTREGIRQLNREDRLELAIEHYRRPGINWSIREIAEEFGVDRKTLKRRLDGGKSHKEAGTDLEKLLPTESIVLISIVQYLYDLGSPPTMCQMQWFANELLQRRLANIRGVHVRSLNDEDIPKEFHMDLRAVRRYIERRPDLQVKLARSIESKRAIQTTRDIAQDFLNKLEAVIQKYHIRDQDIWNMDETGYMIGSSMGAGTRCVLPAREKPRTSRVGADSREWVSIIECIGGLGENLPPYFILKGKVHLERHLHQMNELFEDWAYGYSDNGWTDNEHGAEWLKFFDKRTDPGVYKLAERNNRLDGKGGICRARNGELYWENDIEPGYWRLLILDGHGSHITLDFIEYAMDHKILILQLPPHTSHYLQPLDVGIFTGMKRQYRVKIQQRADLARVKVSKDQFLRTYSELRPQFFTSEKTYQAFELSGIRPISIQPLERHFYEPPLNELQRQLQRRQQTEENRHDKGLLITTTGLGTVEPADSTLTGEAVYLFEKRLVVNPRADYHKVLDQLVIEQDPAKRSILCEAIRNWISRRELESRAFKFIGNAYYESTMQSKKDVAEASNRSHFGLAKIWDKPAFDAEQKRIREVEEELQRQKREKERLKQERAVIKVQKEQEKQDRIAKRKEAAAARLANPPKRQRRAGPSQLSQSFTPDVLDPRLRQPQPTSPLLPSIALAGLGALSDSVDS